MARWLVLSCAVSLLASADAGVHWADWLDVPERYGRFERRVTKVADYAFDRFTVGLDHAELLSLANGNPFCLIAGKYDDATSEEMMRRAKGYERHPERLKLVNHATGHRPPPAATEEGYGFLDAYLKNASGLPSPCDPKPVKKSVAVVRREIKVAIIGADRPKGPENVLHANARNCFAYWKRWMDREIANKPDLVVLPEGVLSYRGYGPDKKREVVQRCGDGLLKLFQSYAREHACYLSFNAYRQRPDGRFANTSFFLDREGDVIGVYDKVYPTPGEIGWKEFPIVPGERPVVVETDFGRVGFAICFDLNFRDLIEAYAKERPDVICFQSAYDGDFWRRVWSYTCRAYLIGCTVGHVAKEIDGPSGEVLMHSHNYFFTSTTKINTNCRVIHLDDNWGGIQKAIDKYGDRFEMRNPGAVGAVTVLSHDPELPIDDVIREFGLVLWDDYYERAVRLRGGPLVRSRTVE